MRAPSAGLPLPVRDFQAIRLGPEVHLQFTTPSSTSDGAAYAPARYGALRYQVCVWQGVEQGAQVPQPATPLPGAGVPAPPQVPARHPPHPGAHGQFSIPSGALMPSCPQLIAITDHALALGALATPSGGQVGAAAVPSPAERQAGGVAQPRQAPRPTKPALVTLALAAENGDGEWAGWSNPVVVALTPVAPPPRLTHIQLTAEGVLLQWQTPEPAPAAVAIYRQQGSTQPQAVGHIGGTATRFLDRSITWGQEYSYWLRSAAGSGRAAVESADSRHVAIRAVDLFPPPAPSGLQVVLSPAGDAVDLSWNAVSAHDLAGYNVYRRVSPNGAWQKRNASPLVTPVFHDELAPAAASVAYAVTAVDMAGNESPRSPAVLVSWHSHLIRKN